MLLTLIYAFGTSSLSVSSQALWQHGPAQLALAAAIYRLIRARDDPRWAGYAGLPLAFEVITRPADALIAAPLGRTCSSATAARSGDSSPPRLAAAAFSTVVQRRVLRDRHCESNFSPSRHRSAGQTVAPSGLWTTSLAEGTGGGGIESRPRTAFLFADFHFLTGRIGARLAPQWRRASPLPRSRRDFEYHAGPAKWHKTSGGESFGPRLLADITPIMALALFPLADSIRNRRALAAAFAMLCAWSITANASGAFISYRGWNQWALNDADQRLWLWADNPVVDPFRAAFDSMRIALGRRPTSRNSPDLIDAAPDGAQRAPA